MANTDNSCKDLDVVDEFSKSENTLADLYNLQKDIQENVYGYDFDKMRSSMTLEQFRQFFDWNYHAIQDELRETFDALGGIKDGIGNAVWKPWKKDHVKASNTTFNDLSEDDKKELKMELIDIQHFLFNMMLAVGMTPDELYNYYFAKNKENRDRQQRGY